MLDPRTLYTLNPELPAGFATPTDRPEGLVLIHALQGFVDAGSAATIVGRHILDTLPNQVIATFSVDELIDYRSRRPAMVYDHDHYASYNTPELLVYLVRDLNETPFLLLSGPEPDVQWERFVAAIQQIIEHFGVEVTAGLHGIGMAVPHTRPVGVIAHANRPDLVPVADRWPGIVQIPGSAAGLLELRLGENGHDAMGFVVQVPHYVAETPYPQAAEVLLDRMAGQFHLDIPREALQTAADETRTAIAEQVAQSEEVKRVVAALEQQYDEFIGSSDRMDFLSPTGRPLPSADELGAEVERFLAAGNPEGWTDLPPPQEPGLRD